MSPVTKPGLPTALATRSASASRRRSTAGGVCEWAVVTVALAASSISARGRPTTGERPMTSADLPASGMS